jgi:hypothetical protein
MRHLKILPIIAITLLAACKSTVPQIESLLEEHVSSAGEICSSSATVPKLKYANPKEKRLYEASNQIIKGVNDCPLETIMQLLGLLLAMRCLMEIIFNYML